MPNDPNGQEKAPEDRCSGSGGQECFTFPVISEGNESMFPLRVKCAAVTRNVWPTWLGSTWLKDQRSISGGAF